jgi:hypothetical protein
MIPRNSVDPFTGRWNSSFKMLFVRVEAAMSRRVAFGLAVVSGLAVLTAAAPARAGDTGPVIAIPTRPGVPIVINGRDASYAVVEGDWGLARPGHGSITVIGGSPITPNPVYEPRNSYHPRYGRPPPRGRNEVDPGPEGPQGAESFSRSWSSSSDVSPPVDRMGRPMPPNTADPSSVPATITDPETFYQPPVVVTPRDWRRRP